VRVGEVNMMTKRHILRLTACALIGCLGRRLPRKTRALRLRCSIMTRCCQGGAGTPDGGGERGATRSVAKVAQLALGSSVSARSNRAR